MSDLISRVLSILDDNGYEVAEDTTVAEFLEEVARLVDSPEALSDEAVSLIGESFDLLDEGKLDLLAQSVSESLQHGSVRKFRHDLGSEGRKLAKDGRSTRNRLNATDAMKATLASILATKHHTGQTPDEDDVVEPKPASRKGDNYQYPRAFAPAAVQSKQHGGIKEGINAGQLDAASRKIGNYGTKQNSGKASKKGATRIVRRQVKRALAKGTLDPDINPRDKGYRGWES